jgi:hypothetical protein
VQESHLLERLFCPDFQNWSWNRPISITSNIASLLCAVTEKENNFLDRFCFAVYQIWICSISGTSTYREKYNGHFTLYVI